MSSENKHFLDMTAGELQQAFKTGRLKPGTQEYEDARHCVNTFIQETESLLKLLQEEKQSGKA